MTGPSRTGHKISRASRPRDPPAGHDVCPEADPVRLLAGRPWAQLELLDALDLSRAPDLVDRAHDDHAPAGLGHGLDRIDLEGGLAGEQQGRELRSARGPEDDRLRPAIEDVRDR